MHLSNNLITYTFHSQPLKKKATLKVIVGGMVFWPLARIFGVLSRLIQVYRTNTVQKRTAKPFIKKEMRLNMYSRWEYNRCIYLNQIISFYTP